MRPYVFGITGASCSGKTSIARRLAERYSDRGVVILPIDAYYLDLSAHPVEERARCNFDTPEAIDFDLFVEDLARLVTGDGIAMPVYDFETHSRYPEKEWRRIEPISVDSCRPILIVEGLFAFYREDLRVMLDLKVFIEAGREVCLGRRLERDVRDRGRTPSSVLEQFERTVEPMFERYVQPARRFADLVVDGEGPLDETVEAVIDAAAVRMEDLR